MACGFLLEQSRNQLPVRFAERPAGTGRRSIRRGDVVNTWITIVLGDLNSPRVQKTYVMVASRQHPFAKIVAAGQRNDAKGRKKGVRRGDKAT